MTETQCAVNTSPTTQQLLRMDRMGATMEWTATGATITRMASGPMGSSLQQAISFADVGDRTMALRLWDAALAMLERDLVERGLLKATPIRQFFTSSHLPDKLRTISERFQQLAEELDQMLPENPERTVALRKLLESKDCAVRAYLWQPDWRG